MHIVVTAGLHDRRKALLGDAHERVRGARCVHSVNGNSHRTVSTTFEANGEGDTRCELAVELRFSPAHARANGTPGDEICDVLRGDGVEQLGADGYTEVREIAEQLSRSAQTLVNFERAVDVRVIDESLPADGRARFLCVQQYKTALANFPRF